MAYDVLMIGTLNHLITYSEIRGQRLRLPKFFPDHKG